MVRVRHRYLLCAIEFESKSDATVSSLSPRAIHHALRTSIESNFGDIGAGRAVPSLAVKFWSPHLGLAVVRAHRDFYETVWAAATLLTSIAPNTSHTNLARVSVIHVGATIRSCQKSALIYSERLIMAVRDANESTERLQAAMETAERELEKDIF